MKIKILISVLILYLIILYLQYKFIKLDTKDFNYEDIDNALNKRIIYNNKNALKLKELFIKNMTERLDLLNSGKLNYNEWIDYNNKNILITIDGQNYYFFIYDQLDKDDQVIAKAYAIQKFINLSYKDLLKNISESMTFTKFTTDPQLINNMFKLSKNGFNDIEYYWLDPLTGIPTKKHSYFNNFNDKKSGNKGIIGIGFETADLNITEVFKYANVIHLSYSIICSFLTIFIALLIILTGGKEPNKFTYIKSILFLIFTNIYIYYFLNTIEMESTAQVEMDKIKSIRDGVLSISFLSSVNIFILASLAKIKIKNNTLFFQSSLLFGTGIFLLLLSTIKNTDYSDIPDLIRDRISLQLTFNFCIIINMLILFNYTTYYLFNKIKIREHFFN